MNTVILSRDNVQKWEKKPGEKAILIRMLEPRMNNLELLHPERFEAILEIYVDDVTQENMDTHLRGSNFVLCTKNEAEQIVAFIRSHKFANCLVVHCTEGKSRSSAVALAYALSIENDKMATEIQTSNKYWPNETILELVSEAFSKQL